MPLRIGIPTDYHISDIPIISEQLQALFFFLIYLSGLSFTNLVAFRLRTSLPRLIVNIEDGSGRHCTEMLLAIAVRVRKLFLSLVICVRRRALIRYQRFLVNIHAGATFLKLSTNLLNF
jgi:hypothetical protein